MASVGKKWTVAEEAQLINEINAKKSYEDIAIIHDRNINGIKSRHTKLINTIKKIEQLTILCDLSSVNELVCKIKAQELITNPLYESDDYSDSIGIQETHILK